MNPGMAFYEYSIYGRRRRDLREVADTLVAVWDCDPTTVSINRAYKRPLARVGRTLRLALGVRDAGDWHLFITGPKLVATETQLKNLVDHYGGFTDGGGYSFDYDPTVHYPEDRIVQYIHQSGLEARALEARILASMTPEQRRQFELTDAEARREFDRAVKDREKYGYAE